MFTSYSLEYVNMLCHRAKGDFEVVYGIKLANQLNQYWETFLDYVGRANMEERETEESVSMLVQSLSHI